jgi:hypothetical protein
MHARAAPRMPTHSAPRMHACMRTRCRSAASSRSCMPQARHAAWPAAGPCIVQIAEPMHACVQVAGVQGCGMVCVVIPAHANADVALVTACLRCRPGSSHHAWRAAMRPSPAMRPISSGAVERWAMSDLRMLLPAWHSATIDQSAAINELRAADEVAPIDRLPAINYSDYNRRRSSAKQ